jgi:hypothetical protein
VDATVDRLTIEGPDPKLVLSETGATHAGQVISKGLLRGPVAMRLWYDGMAVEYMEQTRIVALLTGDFGLGQPVALLCTHRALDRYSFNVWPLLPAYPVNIPDWRFPLAFSLQAIVPDGKRSSVFTGFIVGKDGPNPDESVFSNSGEASFTTVLSQPETSA